MRHPARRRRLRHGEATLALLVMLALTGAVALSRHLDVHRPAIAADLGDDSFYVRPAAVPEGFKGAVADWYWIRTLQYLGRKLESGRVALDRGVTVNAAVLRALLDVTTTLDPRFTAAYEFAAVVLPTVDVEGAIALIQKGIANSSNPWPLYQQLAYIHWQAGDFRAAASAFREGAGRTSARWMEQMAARMDAEGGDRTMAREMYQRLHDQSQDDQVRQWATKRLMQVRSFEEREALSEVLLGFWRRRGTCADRWSDVALDARRRGFRLDARSAPLDPSGIPYLLALSGCAVAVDPRSEVPR